MTSVTVTTQMANVNELANGANGEEAKLVLGLPNTSNIKAPPKPRATSQRGKTKYLQATSPGDAQ